MSSAAAVVEGAPTYVLSYSRRVRLVRGAVFFLLAGGAIANWVLAWIRFAGPAVQVILVTTADLEPTMRLLADTLALQPLRPLLAAHLSLLLAAWALSIAGDLLPDLALADDGLMVRRLRRWTVVPWGSLRAVRAMHLGDERYLVLVQGKWTRLAAGPRLVSLLLGAGATPGILLTSAMRDFLPFMERLYHEMSAAVAEPIYDDDFYSLPAALVLDPANALDSLVDQAREDGWPLSLSAQAMAAVPAGLIVVQLLILLLRGGALWKPLALAGLCGLEWAMGALYLYALTEMFQGRVEFREAALLYPLAQVPRALLALPMAMLAGAGLGFPAAAVGLASVLWAVLLTTLLVQRLYRLKSMLPAVPGALLQTFYQFLILAIVFNA
jgi:hypothetical protein